MIIQIKNVCGFKDSLRYIAFDECGKNDCLAFYDRLFDSLEQQSFIYYDTLHFERDKAFTYSEYFFRLENGKLIEVGNFADCNFYERLFYTSDQDGNDMGIVLFSAYTELNSGIKLKPAYSSNS